MKIRKALRWLGTGLNLVIVLLIVIGSFAGIVGIYSVIKGDWPQAIIGLGNVLFFVILYFMMKEAGYDATKR